MLGQRVYTSDYEGEVRGRDRRARTLSESAPALGYHLVLGSVHVCLGMLSTRFRAQSASVPAYWTLFVFNWR